MVVFVPKSCLFDFFLLRFFLSYQEIDTVQCKNPVTVTEKYVRGFARCLSQPGNVNMLLPKRETAMGWTNHSPAVSVRLASSRRIVKKIGRCTRGALRVCVKGLGVSRVNPIHTVKGLVGSILYIQRRG